MPWQVHAASARSLDLPHRWNGEAQDFRYLLVDGELQRRLLEWKIRWLRTLEDLVDVVRCASIHVDEAGERRTSDRLL
jgi:hypothetical protein